MTAPTAQSQASAIIRRLDRWGETFAHRRHPTDIDALAIVSALPGITVTDAGTSTVILTKEQTA